MNTLHFSGLSPVNAADDLYDDPFLGSGNFLFKALTASQTADKGLFFLEEALRFADGSERSTLSLNELCKISKALASWYHVSGVGPSEVVAVSVREGISAFVHFAALTSLGAVAALINPAMPPDVAAKYIHVNGFTRVFVDCEERAAALRKHLDTPAVLHCLNAFPSDASALPDAWPKEPNDATVVMLCHTSGTTGLPKAVQFCHRQFFVGKRQRLKAFLESADERMLSALPHSHSAGISYLMNAALLGLPTLVLTSLTGPEIRRQLLQFQPTIVTAFPQTYGTLVSAGVAQSEFDFVRRWFSMGDAAHEAHIRTILHSAPQSRFIDMFGSNELGMALFKRESTVASVAHRRSIGRLVDFAEARLLDPETFEELPPGKIGLLAVRSPTITPGYWRQAELTASTWRNGYWLTGDVAHEEKGEYFHVDRAVDVIRSPVGPVYTLLLEEEIQQVDGVCDVSVVGCPVNGHGNEAIVAMVLPHPRDGRMTADDLDEQVFQAIRGSAQLEGKNLPDKSINTIITSDKSRFPCGSTGKILKRALREQFPALLSTSTGLGGHSGIAARQWN